MWGGESTREKRNPNKQQLHLQWLLFCINFSNFTAHSTHETRASGEGASTQLPSYEGCRASLETSARGDNPKVFTTLFDPTSPFLICFSLSPVSSSS